MTVNVTVGDSAIALLPGFPKLTGQLLPFPITCSWTPFHECTTCNRRLDAQRHRSLGPGQIQSIRY